jgi:flagellar FliL protein
VATATDTAKKSGVAAREKRGGKGILFGALAGIVVAAAAGGGIWYLIGKKSAAPAAAPKAAATGALPAAALYFALDPAFVVNLNGPADGPRYLQVEVQLMTRDPVALKNLESNAPAIRSRLLMLFSQVQPQDIADRPGKEKLQAQALAEVQKLMKAETGNKGAEALLFTSFVTQ